MSKDKETVVDETVYPADEAQDTTAEVDKFPLVHKGFGKYEVGGKTYPNKKEALKAQAKLQADEEFANEYGDVMPEGVDIRVIDRSLVFRGSVLEVPMNEIYLQDGTFNPMYDRAWYYAWAARNQRGVSAYQALGYKLFTIDELETMVDEGKAPPHYLSLLQRDGDNLVYEDLVLMRTPRMMWRQRKVEQAKQTEARIRRRSDDALHQGDHLGFAREEISLGA